MPHAAGQQARADYQLVALDAETVGVVADHRGQGEGERGDTSGSLLPVAATAEHQQGDQGQGELAQLGQQDEQP